VVMLGEEMIDEVLCKMVLVILVKGCVVGMICGECWILFED